MRQPPRPPVAVWAAVLCLAVVGVLFAITVAEEDRLDRAIIRHHLEEEGKAIAILLSPTLDQAADAGPGTPQAEWADRVLTEALGREPEILTLALRDGATGERLLERRTPFQPGPEADADDPDGGLLVAEVRTPDGRRVVEVVLSIPRVPGWNLHEERSGLMGWLKWVGVVLAATAVAFIGVALVSLHRARVAVHAAYERAGRIIEGLGAALFVVDRRGRVVEANGAARATAVDGHSIIGAEVRSIERVPAAAAEACHRAASDPTLPPYEPVETFEVGGRAYLARAFPLGAEAGESVLLLDDVTERTQLEHSLAERKRLAEIGELAACVAHELRNPLAAINTYAQLLPKRYDDRAFRAEFLDVVTSEAARLDRILGGILAYAKPVAPQHEPVDLADVARTAVAAQRVAIEGRGIDLIVDGGSADIAIPVVGDHELLRQAFENLLRNACDAVERLPEGRRRVRVTASRTDGYGSVKVVDEGSGMTPDQLAKAFVPFFTTKRTGTGLGLPFARRIAEAHGGSVEIESRENTGTAASLVVPLAAVREGGLAARSGRVGAA